MKDVAISLYFVKWTHFKAFLAQQSSRSLFVRDLDPKFSVYHKFGASRSFRRLSHLYINTSDVLGDCLSKCSCLFACLCFS